MTQRYNIQPDLDWDEFSRICDDGPGGGCTIAQRLNHKRAPHFAAALNATDGITDEALEGGIVNDAFDALHSLTRLLTAPDPVQVGCHCITDHGDCPWCQAQAVLRRAGKID